MNFLNFVSPKYKKKKLIRYYTGISPCSAV